MSQNPNQSPLDQEPYQAVIKNLVDGGNTNATIVRELHDLDLNTTESAIRRFRRRHSLAPAPQQERKVGDKVGTTTAADGSKTITEKPEEGYPKHMDDPDAMLRERGLDPLVWYIDGARVNEWDGPVSGGGMTTYHQLRLTIKPLKNELSILPARSDGWVPPKRTGSHANYTDRRLVVVVGDQQAPYQDEKLHGLFLQWLEKNQPEEGVSLGDTVDFPDISRHSLDPENSAFVNECIQAGHDIFRGYVNASVDTEWTKLIGNHDERIRNLLLDTSSRTQALYGLKRADSPEEKGVEVHALSHLLRLDELGVKVLDPKGSYQLGKLPLTDKLVVIHGTHAKKGSGASSLATLQSLGYSAIMGHTHRQSVVHQTKHEIGGDIRVITGVEAGCMCRVSQVPDSKGRVWPNYATAPDWQQGFATVEIWPDGSFSIDTAKYVNGTLYWRDQRFR